MIWKTLSSAASPGGNRGNLTVLFFHRVLAEPDPMLPDEPTPAIFEAMLTWIRTQFTLLPLEEALLRLDERRLPPAAAAITFDDGYRDNLDVAAPLLQRYEAPATFFITSDFMDGGLMWNDQVIEALRTSPGDALTVPEIGILDMPLRTVPQRRAAVVAALQGLKYLPSAQRTVAVENLVQACGLITPPALMMTADQVRDLARRGFGIGAHTCSHPILTQLPDDQAMSEIAAARHRLEAVLDRDVRLFAYPNGREGVDFTQRHRQMVSDAGFSAAFTTDAGVCDQTSDRWQLPRFTPWDRTEHKFRTRLLVNQFRKGKTSSFVPSASAD